MDSHKKAQKAQEGKMALTVSRKRLLESPDCNLSGERYRETLRTNIKAPIVQLRDIAEVNRKSCDPAALHGDDMFVYLDISAVENATGRISFNNRVKGNEAPTRARRVVQQGDLLLSTVRPNLQAFAYLENVPPDSVASTGFAVVTPTGKVNGRFLYNVVFSAPVLRQLVGRMGKGSYPSITQKDVEEIEIPLPPLEEQEGIVAELDGYRKVIEGARQVIANYKPIIRIDPEWPMVTLGDITDGKPQYGSGARKVPFDGKVRYIRITDIDDSGILKDDNIVSPSRFEKNYVLQKGHLLFARSGSVGRTYLHERTDGCYQYGGYLIRFHIDTLRAIPRFVFYLAHSDAYWRWIKTMRKVGTLSNINATEYSSLQIPLPPLQEQERIVAELEVERAMVDANRKLIEVFEKKIQRKLAEIWSEE